jgi:hypothetical protein
MVRKRGFEPPRGCPRQPLKLVRLPFRHFRVRGSLQSWQIAACKSPITSSAASSSPAAVSWRQLAPSFLLAPWFLPASV